MRILGPQEREGQRERDREARKKVWMGTLPSVSRSPLGLASRGPSFAQSSSRRYHIERGTLVLVQLVYGAAPKSRAQYEPNRAQHCPTWFQILQTKIM